MKPYFIKSKNGSIKCLDFPNIYSQYTYVKDFILNNTFGVYDEFQRDKGWNGSKTVEQSLDGMVYGFEDNTNYFLDRIKSIRPQDGEGEGTYLDVEGDVYDMGAVVSGEPECCLRTGLPSIKPCIRIMVDIAFSGGVTSEQINNRGIAITNLVNTLLINGYLVDLYFMELNKQTDMTTMFTVQVDTKCLSIATIAFLCSTDYFRKIAFGVGDRIRGKQSTSTRGCSIAPAFILNKFKREDIFFIGGSFTNSEIVDNLNDVDSANTYILDLFVKFCEEHKLRVTLNT